MGKKRSKKQAPLAIYRNPIFISIGLIIIALILSKLTTQNKPSNQNAVVTQPTFSPSMYVTIAPDISIPPLPSPDPVSTKIASDLVNTYLKSLEDPSTPLNMRITDYSIEDANGVKLTADVNALYDGIFIGTSFSVKPATTINDSTWAAGSGIPQDNGWIKEKGCSIVKYENGSYSKIEGIGSGCGNPAYDLIEKKRMNNQ